MFESFQIEKVPINKLLLILNYLTPSKLQKTTTTTRGPRVPISLHYCPEGGKEVTVVMKYNKKYITYIRMYTYYVVNEGKVSYTFCGIHKFHYH